MANSLANMINSIQASLGQSVQDQQYLNQPRQIPAASPEFLASAQNPNVRSTSQAKHTMLSNPQPSFTHPLLQQLYNAPGAAARGVGGGISSLANFLGMQAVKPEMAIRENVNDNFITRANQRTTDAIAAQTQ